MYVVPQLPITDARLTSSTVAEPAAGETAWNAATVYGVGDYAYLAANHTRYRRLTAGATAVSPDNDSANWFDAGPTNRWRMFDLYADTATTGASPVVVTITPGQRVNSYALFGLVADQVQIVGTVDGDVVYSATHVLRTRLVRGWRDYFLKPFKFVTRLIQFDLPAYRNMVLTLTATRASGEVSIGGWAIGDYAYIGRTRFDTGDDQLNFSKVERDEFGEFGPQSRLVPRRSVPVLDFNLICEPEEVDAVREERDEVGSAPAVWSGADEAIDHPYFASQLLVAIAKRFTITEGDTIASIALRLEGY